MSIAVRLLGRGDDAMLARVAPDVFDHAVDPYWAWEFLADPRHHLVVAVDEGAGVVVGMASGVHYVHPDKPPELWVNEVGVAPTHQGQGVGTRMLQLLFARGRALGCAEGWVLTGEENAAARRLYAAVGGVETAEPPVMVTFRLDGPGGDATSADLHPARPSETSSSALLELVDGRRGHFRLESGHHGGLWLDLDPLFAQPRRIAPFVAALADAIRPHDVSVVCGPLLGGAFLAQHVARSLDVEFCFTEREMPAEAAGLYQARYLLPRAFASRVRDRRVAMVDDVMSAGSALRGTFAELSAHGASPVVAGALLVLGSAGADFFAEEGVAVEAVGREGYELWPPDACPLCAAGVPLEDVAAPPGPRGAAAEAAAARG